ncbi:hypothetical protein MRX96_058632 [Rhipicephalus microplus]
MSERMKCQQLDLACLSAFMQSLARGGSGDPHVSPLNPCRGKVAAGPLGDKSGVPSRRAGSSRDRSRRLSLVLACILGSAALPRRVVQCASPGKTPLIHGRLPAAATNIGGPRANSVSSVDAQIYASVCSPSSGKGPMRRDDARSLAHQTMRTRKHSEESPAFGDSLSSERKGLTGPAAISDRMSPALPPDSSEIEPVRAKRTTLWGKLLLRKLNLAGQEPELFKPNEPRPLIRRVGRSRCYASGAHMKE